jgi:hypothetical protein
MKTMRRSTCCFSLLVEGSAPRASSNDSDWEAADGECASRAASAWSRIDLPSDRPAYLRTPSQEVPILTTESAEWAETIVLESLFLDGNRSPRLLILSAPGHRVSINGEPAPRVAVAAMRDVLAFGDARAVFVSLFEQPVMGLAGEALAGATCPVCKTVTSAEQEVWQCARCSAVVHNAQPGAGDMEGDGFACLKLSSVCPVCKKPIRTNAGLTWVPSE